MGDADPTDILSKPRLAVALLLACLFGAVVSQIGSQIARHVGLLPAARPYAATREKAILSQAAQGSFPIVLLGDSFAELADMPNLCGQRVLNAGVSGASIDDVANFAPRVLSGHQKIVVVAVGLNDAQSRRSTPINQFRASYNRVLAAIRTRGARPYIIGIPEVDSPAFDPERTSALRAIVSDLGGHNLPSLSSDDGVHPNSSGYIAWKRVVSGACS